MSNIPRDAQFVGFADVTEAEQQAIYRRVCDTLTRAIRINLLLLSRLTVLLRRK